MRRFWENCVERTRKYCITTGVLFTSVLLERSREALP